MKISDIQLKLIEKTKEYLQKRSSENLNVYSSGSCYFPAWDLVPGYAILKLWHEGFKKIFYSFLIFCKDIISISGFSDYHLINKLNTTNKYNKIIVTWGLKNYFLPDGSYQDRYFKINSRETNGALWFLIYVDEVLPEKIDNNIRILARSKRRFKYSFLYLLKSIFKNIATCRFSPKKFLHKASGFTEFSNIVWNELRDFVKHDISTIIMPYECQPFQNKIFQSAKKINNKIKTIGYIHAFPGGLPTQYIFREGSPEKLILSGEDQYYCFKNHLNWKNNQLEILPSTRYSKKSENMSGYIFLPYAFYSTDIIIKSLSKFLNNNKGKFASNLVLRNHPLKVKSKKHLKMIEKIENLLSNYKNFSTENSEMKELSIFLGATSAPIEALERGVKVIHICDDPVFQSYSDVLWPSIVVKRIDDYIYEYELLKKGNLIQLSDSSKVFNESYIN